MRYAALLLLTLSGCAPAASAAVNIIGTIIVKALEIDTAVINEIRAVKDSKADPHDRDIRDVR